MAIDAATIATNAAQPRRVTADGVTAEQHSIPDQIKAAEYAAQQTARASRKMPIRLAKVTPGSAIG